ncbi:uncharacterized protein ColSpa_10570 [Colletotrichum spaethianum]|uniref:Uncharacterized protein n=1 Tax=Colletotrichum spaethianum TaxID=700344 RepID=A0AA37PDU6_9PEZI|nr:uncharacterized protein ColSpa_10570 [Colletotrichum spaethianum]GKT50389.1 hypothetical protein ColSpa_10570 [Colletotrichum spaethianum]
MDFRKDSCEFGRRVGVVAAERTLDDAGGPGMLLLDLGVRTAVKSCWLLLRDLSPGVDADLGAMVGFEGCLEGEVSRELYGDGVKDVVAEDSLECGWGSAVVVIVFEGGATDVPACSNRDWLASEDPFVVLDVFSMVEDFQVRQQREWNLV